MLYNLLLDKVIPNIDQREMLNEESILVDDASATGWTEVKKQGKGNVFSRGSVWIAYRRRMFLTLGVSIFDSGPKILIISLEVQLTRCQESVVVFAL